VHRGHTDAFYVLEGELAFEIGSERRTITISAGGLVAAPPGVSPVPPDGGLPAGQATVTR
jgi:quercetin dioxygenase-like cupin family protein